MNGLLWSVILVPLAYLWGAVPWGLIVARLARGVDVREYGSGRTGMTNVMRTAGVRAGLLVLALDLAKGVTAVLVARALHESSWLPAACGFAALVGHNWSVYIRFSGGRGTATGLGALLALSPWAGLASAGIGLPAVAASRYVSLGSMLGASAGGLTIFALSLSGIYPIAYGLYGLLGAPLVVWQHRENIRRILAGTERKLGQPAQRLQPPLASRERG